MNSSAKVVKQIAVVVLVLVLAAWFGAQWSMQNFNLLEAKPQIIMADDPPRPCPIC